MPLNPPNAWADPQPGVQFSLRTLGEGLTICCIAAAASTLHFLLGFAITCGLLSLWSIRYPQWQVQFSLVMMFGGLSAFTLGVYFIIVGFRLIPLFLREHWLPDVMIALGPVCVILGGFSALFAIAHFVVAAVDDLP